MKYPKKADKLKKLGSVLPGFLFVIIVVVMWPFAWKFCKLGY